MRLTARVVRRGQAGAGFSLLEVVIASALLLITIAAVTTCVVSISRAGTRLGETMNRDRAVRAVADRLGALPFCADSYPQINAESANPAGDLVAAVFPHARPAQNTATASYAAGGEGEAPAGSFVTWLTEDGVQVKCVARFLAGLDGVTALGPEDLVGWDAAAAGAPPAPTLAVRVTVEGGGSGVTLVRSALTRAPVSLPSATAGAL
jgi:hypothetical protein